jgi:hypothetical protein
LIWGAIAAKIRHASNPEVDRHKRGRKNIMAKTRSILAGAVAALAMAVTATAGGLEKGTPDIKSAGPLAFGPDGILFVGDTTGSALFAIDTGDRGPAAKGTLKVEAVNRKIAEAIGTTPDQILVNDLAINPASGKAYISVSRGKGPSAAPVIVRIDASGKVEPLMLENVKFAKALLPDAPTSGNARNEAITDLVYVDGRVFIAGLSNEEFSSRLLAIPYPFGDPGKGTSIEIYHGAHGKLETKSPVRTFAAYQIKGEPYLMAAYTCTPLVKLPVAALKPGTHYKGTTVAELGNMNKPLDMVVYQKDGKDYILLANSARGLMKIKAEGIDNAEAITARVNGTKGQTYETIKSLEGVVQLDAYGKEQAVVLIQEKNGSMNLETIDLP